MGLEKPREEILEEEKEQAATKKPVKDFPCAQCTQVCKNQYHLNVHVKAKHEQKEHKCKYCDRTWPTSTQRNGHQSRCSKRTENETVTLEEEDPRCLGEFSLDITVVIIDLLNFH